MADFNLVSRSPEAPENPSRREFLGWVWAAAAVTGILGSSNSVEAQERPRTYFRTFPEARQYAENNGFVMVNTSQNGTVFISQSNFNRLQNTPGFEVRASGTGIHYVVSSDTNTRARIVDEVIIGWRHARITIEEARQQDGPDPEEDTPESTDEDTPESTEEDTPEETFEETI